MHYVFLATAITFTAARGSHAHLPATDYVYEDDVTKSGDAATHPMAAPPPDRHSHQRAKSAYAYDEDNDYAFDEPPLRRLSDPGHAF